MAESVHNVVVEHGGQQLGFSITGGTDARGPGDDPSVMVSLVVPGGAAALAGLEVNDRIVEINGNSAVEVAHDEAVSLMRLESDTLRLQVVRKEAVESAADAVIEMSELDDGPPLSTADSDTLDTADRSRLAQLAFRTGDKELSRLAHSIPPEGHQNAAGGHLKAAVFGGLDGIITTFAVVASVAGANLDTSVILVLGFANLFADGVSMGFGEYLSSASETQHIRLEREREAWEFENAPEAEIEEMVDLYKEKGFDEADAKSIMQLMSKHKEFFIDHMLVQELGYMPPEEDESHLKSAVVIFVSFITFGLIPLMSYLLFDLIPWGNGFDPLFTIACLLTAAALFTLGAVKVPSKFSAESWWKSGLWILANGATAAGVAYLVGFVLEQLVSTGECSK